METIFDSCVDILYAIANLLGITYKEANIWIFVIIEPIAFIIMFYIIIKQSRKIKQLKL